MNQDPTRRPTRARRRNQVEGFVRGGWADGQEVEIFTLTVKGTDHIVFQAVISPSGEVQTWSGAILSTKVDAEKKHLHVDVLCDFKVTPDRVAIVEWPNELVPAR